MFSATSMSLLCKEVRVEFSDLLLTEMGVFYLMGKFGTSSVNSYQSSPREVKTGLVVKEVVVIDVGCCILQSEFDYYFSTMRILKEVPELSL